MKINSYTYEQVHTFFNVYHFFSQKKQGEPGKAGEKGLVGAPGLRVSNYTFFNTFVSCPYESSLWY